ncbi:MAG: ATP synthase F1 subunit gamma [Oscillospiraceae bacterium]|nr:ATP synthase F1 subunit gamma [Oscillospiraceae bacterium]
MANLRKIRTRIKSVESTRQITKSMKMVAAAKLRRTQASFNAQRDFAARCAAVLSEVSVAVPDPHDPLLLPHPAVKTVCWVLVVGNRGLCGTYNHALLRYVEELARADGRDCFLVVCGRWGRDLLPGTGLRVERSFEISDTPTSAEAAELAAFLRELYLSGRADEIRLVYQQYRSVLQQTPGEKRLLPIPLEEGTGGAREYLFEPDRDALLEKLLGLYLQNTVHSVLLEARTGEHSARMTAMTAAADNTEELIGELTLELNHARQSAITTEISEIVGGAAALRRDGAGAP